MAKELNPYQAYTGKWLKLLDNCRNKKNPAFWLYANNARGTLFMLESISRILHRANNDSTSKKWNKVFKSLEDMLGQIDYYDVLYMLFSKNKRIEKEVLDYIGKKKEKAIHTLNKDLAKKDFYKKFMIEFTKKTKFNFNDLKLLRKLEDTVKVEILECHRFYVEFPEGFDDMENQVHELRRKLRWISIYAQSLQGIVELKKPAHSYRWEKYFVTKDVKASPFNQLPAQKGLKHYIVLNKTAFYALSFVIGELGKIKDRGMNVEALAKALHKTGVSEKNSAVSEAMKKLGERKGENELLKEAHALLERFFNTYQIHEVLINAA